MILKVTENKNLLCLIKEKFNLSYGLINKLFRNNKIKVIRESQYLDNLKVSTKLKINDELMILIKDINEKQEEIDKFNKEKKLIENFDHSKYSQTLKNIILFENEHLIIIDKPHGLASQGGHKISMSLDKLVKYHYLNKNLNFPKLVHRLDKSVGGLMFMMKEEKKIMIQDFLKNDKQQILKTYYAVCQNIPNILFNKQNHYFFNDINQEFYFSSNYDCSSYFLELIGKDVKLNFNIDKDYENHFSGIIKFKQFKIGKKSFFDFSFIKDIELTQDNKCYTILEYQLISGRKNQIRKNLSNCLNIPILGDKFFGYSGPKLDKDFIGLYSFKLSFSDYLARELDLFAFKSNSMIDTKLMQINRENYFQITRKNKIELLENLIKNIDKL